MRGRSQPNESAQPRWARIAVVTYLLVTLAVVVTSLLAGTVGTGWDARFKEGVLLAMVVLTLPVSAAYFVIGTFGSGGGPMSTTVLYYSGYLLLAVVNAGFFRWVVGSARKRTPDSAPIPVGSAQYPGGCVG